MFDDDDFDEDNVPIPVGPDTTPGENDLLPIAQRVALRIAQGNVANGAIVPFPPELLGRAILDALTGDERRKHEGLIAQGFAPTPFEYLDAEGRVIFVSVRYDHSTERKVILPLRYSGRSAAGPRMFWFNLPKGTTPLFGADQLAARPDAPVLVVEGEKTAQAAATLFPDYAVVTWPSGAGNVGRADVSLLAGRALAAWPDNDMPGRKAARTMLARALGAGAVSAAFVDVPEEFGEGWDLADPVPEAGTGYDVAHLLRTARAVTQSELAFQNRGADALAGRRLLGHQPGYSKVPIEAAESALSINDPDIAGGMWRRIARCWYHAYGAAGLATFDAWSQRGDKYRADEPAQLWAKFAEQKGFVASPLAWLLRMARRQIEERQLNLKVDPEAVVLAEIDAMNADHAVVMRGGKTLVVREEFDPRFDRFGLIYMRKADLIDKHVRRVQLPGEDGKPGKFQPLGKLWFETARRREYDSVIFLPGGNAGLRNLNLWRGFAVEPADNPAGWSKLKDHIRDNIAGGDEQSSTYIMNWLAFAVQHLDQPVRTALVLIGAKGTGKSILSVLFGYIFGDHHYTTAHPQDVLGKFNAHLEYVMTLGLEEAVAPDGRVNDGVFKHLINSDVLRLEEKFAGVWKIPNHLRIMLTSNNEHVVRADGHDRRYAVFSVTHPHVGDPDARRRYFGELVEQMESGGYEAMLGELLARDVSKWNPEAIPETEALKQQKLLTLTNDPVKSWLHERLMDGTQIIYGGQDPGEQVYRWSEHGVTTVPVRSVLNDFVDYAARNGLRASERKFSMGLPRYMPAGFTSRVAKIVDGDLTASSHRVYDFPALADARAAFAKATGLDGWGDEGGET
ncbi:MAG: hypothetical protein EON59_04365 [Alphaproteobacteria bacterium]|nr:MAG: hypothetical protein EON59_04365 [Alphaproteobacteria bacterium]